MRLLAVRASARAGLLSSAGATAAVAVATVCLVLAWLAGAVASAGDLPPPGVSEEAVAEEAALGAAALSSAAVALVLLVAILAATAVAQLARLTAAAREHESATIRARGFSRPQAWAADAAEGVAVALVGTATGVLLALAVAALAGVAPRDVLMQWPWALATALLLAAVFAVALRRGESRRTSSRGARATRPRVLIADEPTGQLDSCTAATIMDLISGLVHSQGLAAMVSTHDPLLVQRADRVIDLHDGRVTAVDGQPAPAARA